MTGTHVPGVKRTISNISSLNLEWNYVDHSDAIGNELTFVQTYNRMLATVLISGRTQNPFGCAPICRRIPNRDTLHQS
jgi:hypothetical protein